MASEKCVFCGEDWTPYFWIDGKGHACYDCGLEPYQEQERKKREMKDSELTEEQVKKALDISLDGATEEEVEAIKETQEEKGRGHLVNKLLPSDVPVGDDCKSTCFTDEGKHYHCMACRHCPAPRGMRPPKIEHDPDFGPTEVIDFEPIVDFMPKNFLQDHETNKETIMKSCRVPPHLIDPDNLTAEHHLPDMESEKDLLHPDFMSANTREMAEAPPLETMPQKTVRLLNEASTELLSLLEEVRKVKEDPTWGNDTPVVDLIRDLMMHAETGVIAPNEYEMATIWLAQQSGKPLRQVRRVLASKLNIKKDR